MTNGWKKGLAELFRNYTFVGCADPNFALVQHKTKLYLVNVCAISEQVFYQVSLRRFSNFGTIRLSPSLPLEKILELAFENPASGWTPEEGDKHDLIQVRF